MCSYCGRHVGTKTGRGLHTLRAHPSGFNQAMVVSDGRVHWSEEELRLMANLKFELTQGNVKNINQRILLSFPGRTINSIKGARKKPAYILVLREISGVTRHHQYEPQRALMESHPQMTATPTMSDDDSVLLLRRALHDFLAHSGNLPEKWNPRLVAEFYKSALNGVLDEDGFWFWLELTFPPDLDLWDGVGYSSRIPSARNRYGGTLRRRSEYAYIQRLWTRDKKAVVDKILDGTYDHGSVSLQELDDYWGRIICTQSKEWSESLPGAANPLLSELVENFLSMKLKIMSLNYVLRRDPIIYRFVNGDAFPMRLIKAALFNCFMLLDRVPKGLCTARLTLIPKKESPSSASDYRPITVASVILRHYQRMLAYRKSSVVRFHRSQRGFIASTDGIAQSVVLLDGILKDSLKKKRELRVAILDVTKAFDSVSHLSYLLTYEPGVSLKTLSSTLNSYIGHSMVFVDGLNEPKRLHIVGRGVRQGYPLSPLVFNLTMDLVLERLSSNIGYWYQGMRITSMPMTGSDWMIQDWAPKVAGFGCNRLGQDWFGDQSF